MRKASISYAGLVRLVFFFSELKHEVLGEPIRIPLYGLVENPSLNSVEFGQVNINHDFLASDQIDSSLDELHRNR